MTQTPDGATDGTPLRHILDHYGGKPRRDWGFRTQALEGDLSDALRSATKRRRAVRLYRTPISRMT